MHYFRLESSLASIRLTHCYDLNYEASKEGSIGTLLRSVYGTHVAVTPSINVCYRHGEIKHREFERPANPPQGIY